MTPETTALIAALHALAAADDRARLAALLEGSR